MTWRGIVALALPALVFAGCATAPTASSAVRTPVELRPDTRPRGRIATVNTAGQFVVVDFNLGAIPPLPSPMTVYRGADVVGRIRLTGPSRDNLVAGDIISGEPLVGDEAILDGE